MLMYYTVCYCTAGIFYAVVRQISMLFIDNGDSVFCKSGVVKNQRHKNSDCFALVNCRVPWPVQPHRLHRYPATVTWQQHLRQRQPPPLIYQVVALVHTPHPVGQGHVTVPSASAAGQSSAANHSAVGQGHVTVPSASAAGQSSAANHSAVGQVMFVN